MFSKNKKIIFRDAAILLALFLVSLGIVVLGAYYGGQKYLSPEYNWIWKYFPDPRLSGHQPQILDLLFPSDAQIHLEIADNWYQKNFLTWFPLYPFFIRAFDSFVANIRISALIASNLAFYLSLLTILSMIKNHFGSKTAWITILLILFFPYSVCLHTGHSESVFLLTAVLSFYFFEKRNYALIVLFASLACISRPYGIIVAMTIAIAFIVESFTKRFDRRMLSILISPVSLFIYSCFNYYKTGDWLFWVHGRANLNVGGSITLQNLLHLKLASSSRPLTIELVTFFIFLLILLISILNKEIRSKYYHYWIFALFLVVTPIIMNNLIGYGRYVATAFPVFLFAAIYFEKNRRSYFTVILTLALLIFLLFFISIQSAQMVFIA